MVGLGACVGLRSGSDISGISGVSALCRGVFLGRGLRTGSAISTAPLGATLVLVIPNARPAFSPSAHS